MKKRTTLLARYELRDRVSRIIKNGVERIGKVLKAANSHHHFDVCVEQLASNMPGLGAAAEGKTATEKVNQLLLRHLWGNHAWYAQSGR
ncbi:MAG: hypothetical protein EDM74_06685 [Armatimonadetes bacterium]|nr:MAG: hypothetical protein EDM74_06685 [Armatimonadota bacterium]